MKGSEELGKMIKDERTLYSAERHCMGKESNTWWRVRLMTPDYFSERPRTDQHYSSSFIIIINVYI